jgi:predicted metal-binding membrane protein
VTVRSAWSGSSGRSIRATLGWRPEWPIALFVAAAWVVHVAHEIVHGQVRHGPVACLPLVDGLPGWTAMSVAMMVPATLPAVRHLAFSTLRVRRRRAMAIYTGAYVAIWIAFGIVVLSLVGVVRTWPALDQRLLLVVALAGAAVWQLTPWKRRALFACRRTVPLPPVGRKADVACLRYAAQQARRCIVSCWPIMVAMAVAGHVPLLGMVALAALVVVEELPLVGWRWSRRGAIGLAVAAVFVAAAA